MFANPLILPRRGLQNVICYQNAVSPDKPKTGGQTEVKL